MLQFIRGRFRAIDPGLIYFVIVLTILVMAILPVSTALAQTPTPVPAAGLQQPGGASDNWIFLLFSIIGIVLPALALVIVVPIVLLTRKGPYGGGLQASLPQAIMMAVFVTLISYFLQLPHPQFWSGFFPNIPRDPYTFAAISGAIVGLIWWPLSAAIYTLIGAASVRGANARNYGMLTSRLLSLNARLKVLDDAIDTNPPDPPNPANRADDTDLSARAALANIQSYRNVLEEELFKNHNGGGTKWVLGEGYIDMWNRLHRAEESMLRLEPANTLVGQALYDQMRLEDSNMANRDDLAKLLNYAAANLIPPADSYLTLSGPLPPMHGAGGGGNPHVAPPAPAPAPAPTTNPTTTPTTTPAPSSPPIPTTTPASTPATGTVAPVAAPSATRANVGAPAPAPAQENVPEDPEKQTIQDTQARMALIQVRRALNEFRDARWEALVQARNRLVSTIVFTMFAAYGLVVFSILQGVEREALFAATVFFFIGALTGLFNRQRIEAQFETDVDDYGVTRARLIHTTLISGLAAVAGVVLVGIAPSLVNAQAVTPQAPATVPITSPVTNTLALTTTTTISTTTQITSTVPTTITINPQTGQATGIPAGATAAPANVPKLEDVFNIERNTFGLIVAATFGLAPSLLIGALQKQVERLKGDIKSTEAQGASRPKT